MNRKLTDIELSMVCEAIASRMGLHFPVERWAMLRRNLVLAAREFGFHNMTGFIQWLLSAPLNKEQTDILAAHLTISETYFWREPQVFTALTDFILPELIRSKGKEIEERSDEIPRSGKGEKSIRIWSAGCSTGEEPYSIAIALHKTIQKIEDWNITILATDINPRALNKAVSGIYGTWSFRNSPSWLKSSYFHHNEDRQYEIIPEIKQMVTFTCLSLVEMSAISNANTMDIIFCRNVLMYFTKEWVNKISQDLFHSLSEDGWFVVSSSELSSQVFPQFTPVNFPGAVLYRKSKKESAHSLYSAALAKEEIQPIQPIQPFQPLQLPSTPFNPLQLLSSVALAKEDLQPFNSSTLQQPQAIPEETSADKIFAIRLLANQGYLSEALSLCNEAIAAYKLSSGLYFLRASILQELDKSSEAIASLKQAIYIDPDYIMGHFALGNLFIRQGKAKNAKRYFNNVLDLLSRCKRDDILPESEGLSVNYIRDIILTGLQTQESK
ncbi:MAG: tetratricopeptide repeat protein [Bacteroidia bacterium]|nr:tetratricopeptide repeat protein [Bacteroidia bacterium]